MPDKCEIKVTIPMEYILWMLDHPDELNEDEQEWVRIFTSLMLGETNETQMGMATHSEQD